MDMTGECMKRIFWLFVVMLISPWPSAAAAAAVDIPPLEGLIEPWEIVAYSSPVPGILEKVHVERGSWVKPGMVIAQLKSGVERAGVELAKARVDFGKRKLERNEKLYTKRLVSMHERDELETDIKLAELALREAEERLDLLIIRSTVKGVVVERLGAPGEFVGEEPFLTIAQVNPLRVEVIAPAYLFGRIAVGDRAMVQVEEPVNGEYSATVVIVDNVMDAGSSTFGVRLKVENREMELPAGMKCRVVFEAKP